MPTIAIAGIQKNWEEDDLEKNLDKKDKIGKIDDFYVLQDAHLDFVDNVKDIVIRKDIVPKFYDGDLSALLTRTIIIVFLTMVVTVSKLIFENHKNNK